ncbi:MAG: NUDIX domain-containing protein [Candidatus Pacebacteria bacterium]|nr:NUDIX domain-containing protein [Candidatus Paceibacterota bacterium]
MFEKVAKREVLEEVGLNIKNIGYLTSMSFIRPEGIPAIIVSLYADYESGEIKLENSLTDYKWVTLEESKKVDLIEGIYEELEMLDKFLKTGEAIL